MPPPGWTLSGGIFDLDGLRAQLSTFERETEQPGFWSDASSAQKRMKEIAALKARIEPVERLEKSLTEIRDLRGLLESGPDEETEAEVLKMEAKLLEELDRVEITTLLNGRYDAGDAILEIGAGAGGTEACDWARMLLRMYSRWAERKRFEFQILSETPGEVTGYRNVTCRVSGPFAYGSLRSEHGVHRLVRISPFDAGSRRHTSFAMVSVTPVVEESEVAIRQEDLKIDTYRSSGAGGQHVNKTESAVRITHLPTGVVVTCQTERSQHQNRASAMTILASRLAELEQHKSEQTLRQLRGEMTSADWGSQIRSYVMQPYTLVKDQRTGFETGNVLAVLDGEIDEFIAAYLRSPASKTA